MASSDDLIFGASCGFRVFDDEGLHSMLYGVMAFGDHITRIQLQPCGDGRKVAKVWGDYQGIVVSKEKANVANAASVLGRRISWSHHAAEILRDG